MGPCILITGATGFIGGRVAALAAAHPGPGTVRLLVRRPDVRAAQPPVPGGPRTTTVPGDLLDPGSLSRAVEGADVLIHCASAIGADEEQARAVNDEGTRALVDAATRAGVGRIVALSTASVHGRGPFHAATPGSGLPLAPGSVTSRTRAAGERHVLDAGGTVLRPHLVYGAGDRQVIPGLVRLLTALPGRLDGGTSLHSLIDVEALAGALLGAALSPATEPGPYYAVHPEPVPVGELITAAEGLLVPRAGVTEGPATDLAGARELLAGLSFARHHLDMLATDHWFVDARPWRDLGCDPGPRFTDGFAAHRPWYREAVRRATVG
ncbi:MULTISPECIES: NAD-dependent epimerase/dehydratase family protein [unclassified Streptomyces]|uniref:NAD-dependent epimerase/dehydratase family protein n=1 Tax=unclassified Streptomyces TaxID=2593676 RepID=UPI001660A6CA|nr:MULTISPECIES: NAD-dependent epimerase/dehydratase family protein [unclassified Streptomyces]MBD0709488.1 epimerase [Streptomyces sp. CBMA291]MBD0713198.1 epimerase [Streptomyces sp. CBMA370]